MLSKRIQQNLLRKFRRMFDVTIILSNLEDASGQTDTEAEIIELDKSSCATSKARFLSTLCHEVVHIYAARNGIFELYHRMAAPEDLTIKELEIFIRTAWRAERWTEKTAATLMQELFPGEMYWWSYGRLDGRQRSKDWFDTVYLKDYRKELRKRKLRAIDKEKRNERKTRKGN